MIGIIGDVHSNAGALQACLAKMRERGVDRFIFLGDLLTYGPEPERTLEILMTVRNESLFLLGNHDDLYLKLFAGENPAYLSRLPEWIRESVDWTASRVDPVRFREINFQTSFREKKLFVSHANPYGEGDWTYVDSRAEYAKACTVLRGESVEVGIFGHTHRPKVFLGRTRQLVEVVEPSSFDVRFGIVNAGSIGQPRGGKCAFFVVLGYGEQGVVVEFIDIGFDFAETARLIKKTSLSDTSKVMLSKYFV